MRKGKNFLTLLLCVLVACVMLVACQPAVDPVQLVGFEDVTWTAELGETYTLPAGTALDTKDNDYRVTYTVKTKSGVDVTVSTNQFIVTDMAGYVITGVTDTLPDGTTKTRTITLNVEDKSAPDIIVESAGFGYAGRENNLPKITVTDLSGESITPVVKVYLVEGATETEITVANGKFTPTKKGKYRLNVSATDSAGNKGEKDVEIFVRGAMAPYVLEDFGDEYGNQTLTGNKAGVDASPATWMESYDPTPEDNANDDAREGVSAVVSTLNSYGPHLYVRLSNEIRTVNFEYVYARVYVKSEIAEYRPTFEAFTWNHKLGDFPVNEWVEVRLSVADINSENANFSSPGMKQEGKTPMEVFRDSITSGSGTYLFWIPMRSYTDGSGTSQTDIPTNYTIYFDEIGYRPTFTPVLETKEQYELGETITLNATVDTQLDASSYSFVYSVNDPSGNAVTLDENNSFRAIETGKYSVTVDFIHNEYSGTASYELNVVGNKEIVIGEFTDTPAMGDTVTVPSGSINGGTVTVSVLCNGTTVEMDGNSFVASVAGVYEVVYAAEIDGLIYKTVLEIEVEHALADNEILGFNRVEDIDSLILGAPGGMANAEWLPSFEGHDGVAKITYGGSDWPWISFVPAYEMSAYENSAYIMVRMYVASGGNELSYMVLGNDGLIQSKPDGYDGTVAYDKWEDYKFDAKPFLEFWTDGMINSDKARLWFFSKDASAEGTIYISDIYVIANPSASGIELVVDGDKRDGQQLTVTMDVPSGVTGAQMTVKDPNGEVVTLTNGKFTAVKGVYTVEITCDGYPGVWKQTFEVVDAYDVTINGDAVVDGKNVTLPTVTVSNPVTGDDVTDDATVEVAVAYGETAITVTDNKFTGTFAGFYEVTWTINYEGKTVIKTYSVLIEGSDEIQEGEVEFFSTPASLDRVEMGTTTGKSYVNDAPTGATHGSVAFDISQVGGVDGNNWPRLAVAARQEKSAYENADAIALTIKIVGKEGATVELVFWSDNSERVVVPLNVWTTVTVSAEKFLANFDHLGVLEEAKGWFWFTNINANTAHKFIINEIKVVAKLTSENALLDLKNEGALLSVSSSGITEYVSAADVNEDSTLPALPQGENAYIKFTGKGNSWAFFDVRISPMCSEETFVNADALEFSVYTRESRSIYFYNTNIVPTTAGEWTKIVLPISIWKSTKNIYKNYGSAEDWYNSLVNDSAPFVSIVGVSATTDETMYLSSVRFVDIPEDETLGDKYAHISTDTVTVNRGSVEQGTYFGKEAVKITSTNTWVNVFVKPGKTEKELRQYTKARFSVYLEGSVNVELYSQRQANGTEGNDFVPYGFAKPGQWVELEVSVDRLLDLYAECYLGINAFMIDRGAAFDALYLADIVLVKEIEGVTITVTEGALREGDEVTVGYTNENNVDGLTLTVTNGEGVEVVLDGGKFVAEADNYTVTISKDGYDPLVKTFTVYPAIEVEIGDAVINGREVTIGTPVIKDPSTGDAITEGVSVSVTVTFGGKEITLGSGAKFIAAYAGTYVVTYTVNYNDKGYDYTDEVVVVNDAPKANEVLSFSSADELVKVDMGVNNITFTEEWLAEFEGETGVVKFNFSGGDWPYMGFGTNQDMSAYADYDYLTVTFYAPSAGNSIKYLKLGANTEKDTWPIGYESTIEKDKWHTYVFDITVFKNHWKPNLNEFDWNNLYKLWFYSTSKEEGTFYVSDISVMKGASKAGLIVKTEGELREGKTFSVSYENPNEIANVTMVVKAPDGSVVDDVTAITGVYGTYTVEFTCDGYYGVGIEEFNVVPAIEFTVGELSYADGVITIPTYSIT
ncbi:MAG: hypothetical protein IKD03_04315, partial [Clostridia bacterium]|nr:hypothetical protein [Clostridia bacterium]